MANILPLEDFRRAMGLHPWHWWGMSNTLTPQTAACPTVAPEYAWQKPDVVGRAEIREAIESAESKLAEYLGYYPAPHYGIATLPFPQYRQRDLWRYGYEDPSGRWIGVRLPEGKVLALGRERRTLLGSPRVAYSDPDGDGLDELATATLLIADTTILASDIACYFASTDLAANTVEPYRIEPLQISLTAGVGGNTATITGPAWIFVRPILYEGVGLDEEGLDPSLAATFVGTIDVYHRYTDENGTAVDTAQCTLHWETQPWPEWCELGASPAGSSDPGLEARAAGRCGIRDAENGIVLPAEAVYDPTTATWASGYDLTEWVRLPDRVTVRYLAGVDRDSYNRINRSMQTLVARMAAAEVGRPIYACAEANREVYRWQFDLDQSSGANDEMYGFTPQAALSCPFGTRRGHVWAYQQVQNLQQLPGIAVG